jgi:hypothetical protein
MRPFKDSASTNSEVYLALVATIEAAYAVSAWLQRADRNDSLGSYFNPPLTPEERESQRSKGGYSGWFEKEQYPARSIFSQN